MKKSLLLISLAFIFILLELNLALSQNSLALLFNPQPSILLSSFIVEAPIEGPVERGSIAGGEGPEEEVWCTDTDGGKNYKVKGTAYSERDGSTGTDFCPEEGEAFLIEYYCEHDLVYNETVNCIDKFGPRWFCSDGRCTNVTGQNCEESDNGKNYTQAGKCECEGIATYSLPDTCIDSTHLNESYCNGSNFCVYETVDCREVQCNSEACTNCSIGECVRIEPGSCAITGFELVPCGRCVAKEGYENYQYLCDAASENLLVGVPRAYGIYQNCLNTSIIENGKPVYVCEWQERECYEGDEIAMKVEFTPECLENTDEVYFQADARSGEGYCSEPLKPREGPTVPCSELNDESSCVNEGCVWNDQSSCVISENADMIGINFTCSSEKCYGTYKISNIPESCEGKTLYVYRLRLYNSSSFDEANKLAERKRLIPPGFGSFSFFGVPEGECYIAESCDENDYALFSVSKLFNAHASINTESYPYKVCCPVNKLSCDDVKAVEILKFSADDNAHVELSVAGVHYEYETLPFCLEASLCTSYYNETRICPEGYHCVVSLSNATNAHVSPCYGNAYPLKVCCKW